MAVASLVDPDDNENSAVETENSHLTNRLPESVAQDSTDSAETIPYSQGEILERSPIHGKPDSDLPRQRQGESCGPPASRNDGDAIDAKPDSNSSPSADHSSANPANTSSPETPVDIEIRCGRPALWALSALKDVAHRESFESWARRAGEQQKKDDVTRIDNGNRNSNARHSGAIRIDALCSRIAQLESAGLAHQVRKRLEGVKTDLFEQLFKVFDDFPWGDSPRRYRSLSSARRVLSSELVGQPALKSALLGHIANAIAVADRGLRPTAKALLLVGPPGVGKTSVAKAVASGLGVPYEHISLSGRSSAFSLQGSEGDYERSGPGSIVRAIISHKCRELVILLDEVDKVGTSHRHGTPTEALLSLIEPEQARAFKDVFVDVSIDASSITFLATANEIDKVDAPLLDRFEVINVSGYSRDDFYMIAKQSIMPRQIVAGAFDPGEVTILESAYDEIASHQKEGGGARHLVSDCQAVLRAARVVLLQSGLPAIVDDSFVRAALAGEIGLTCDETSLSVHESWRDFPVDVNRWIRQRGQN